MSVMNWINAKQQEVPMKKRVLVKIADREILYIGEFVVPDRCYLDGYHSVATNEVTHWGLLPEPPEERTP